MGMRVPSSLPRQVDVSTPSDLSPTAVVACAGFGLIAKHTEHHQTKAHYPDTHILDQIRSSTITLVTGASGAGKTCMLRGIHHSLALKSPADIHIAQDQHPLDDHRCMIDLLDGPLESRTTTLASAGLAEPRLWALPRPCLSIGERSRLALAITMHHARPSDIVIADEFGTPMDRVSAYALARTMSRWARSKGITLIAATAHEDMEHMLTPDLTVDMNNQTTRTPSPHNRQPITIEHGTISDYRRLAHLHYRGAQPATHTLVLRATRTCPIVGEILAGVLVVSMPTLNSAWRNRAWPGVFSTESKTINAKRINKHLRCISRVIIDPRSRGLGIASALVRAYLEQPQTTATESIAAMGSVCPFIERAGMQRYPLDHTPIDLRLIDAINATDHTLVDLITYPIEQGSLIERELITWSKARRIIGSGAHDTETVQRLAPIAACRLLSKPRAYAHVYRNGEKRE